MIEETLLEAEEKMEKAVVVAKEDFAAIRTGRAHPAMFNKIVADYYGALTPINQLASFSVPEPRMAVVTPFDKSALRNIEQAIRDSDLGRQPEQRRQHHPGGVPRADRGAPQATTSRSPGPRPRTPRSRSAPSAARPRTPSTS